ncbi:hypothetical protein CXQ85_002062 [Candidozyma haemuli]|uniref:very-long-chain (3R)-3-hydroxyacyl-CoA dehydratase n=1 Tax=Candidozyma haemuli TaxID=45357 RepID=A0A2V1APX0_9ASCO|nr:hypothetical protein CXQ85_002062 [[Candida] haemuloni]PVH20277.1 hypothetical protein CXQ85_002062 [[Candida] haemuloni]
MALYPLYGKQKLIFYYNVVSTTLWFCCLCRFLILLPLVGRKFLPAGIADFFHVVSVFPLIGWVLVTALVKTQHSWNDLWGLFDALRMVWMCYGVIFPHPKIAKHTSYSFLISSWCIQNLIDSFYHGFKTKTRTSPLWLFWLHHHHFYLTFFVSCVSEMILIFLSLGFVKSELHEWVLKACILAYVPVGYFLFGYLRNRQATKYDAFMEKRNRGRVQNQELPRVQQPSSAVDQSSR